jgi:uncharacterized membrane protein YgdD (TMEM256/DUF423 family)
MKFWQMARTDPYHRLQAISWLRVAAVNGLLAVAAGAFGAHGLEGKVPTVDLAAFRTAAQYHMYHALALLAVAWLTDKNPGSLSHNFAGWSFVVGITLFCGSLYVLGVTGSRSLVMLTPLGGMAFMLGWGAMALSALTHREA